MTRIAVAQSHPVLSAYDLQVLQTFAQIHGRCWKSRLRELWLSGRDAGELRRLRNVLGPSGLAKIQF